MKRGYFTPNVDYRISHYSCGASDRFHFFNAISKEMLAIVNVSSNYSDKVHNMLKLWKKSYSQPMRLPDWVKSLELSSSPRCNTDHVEVNMVTPEGFISYVAYIVPMNKAPYSVESALSLLHSIIMKGSY